MLQVLFHVPGTEGWFPPEGLPVHGFGVMLFITFIVCVWFLGWRSRRTNAGLPKDRIQDLVIVVFIGGLLGARITFMIQYDVPFRQMIRIWEGGIVLYGGIISGMLAFLAFFYLVLKKSGVSIWKLADVVGPGLALGIALGRIGCFLNGCCYGHIAPEGCPSAGFPLLTCPARCGCRSTVISNADGVHGDFRSRGSSLGHRTRRNSLGRGQGGIAPGDRIVGVNGRRNVAMFLVLADDPEVVKRVVSTATDQGATVQPDPDGNDRRARLLVEDVSKFSALRTRLNAEYFPFRVRIIDTDVFSDLINSWPRGDQSLSLEVERGGQVIAIGPFIPRTLGLHPTQLYEVVSMVLLIFFLLSYYPFRKYDGQLFTLFVVGYAIHRFLNETLRNDTDIVGIKQLHMTLSQNISVLMLLFAACLEIGRRRFGGTPRLRVPQKTPA